MDERIVSVYKGYELKIVGEEIEINKISPVFERCANFNLDDVKEYLRAGQGDCDHCDPVLPSIFLTDRVTDLEKLHKSVKIKQDWFKIKQTEHSGHIKTLYKRWSDAQAAINSIVYNDNDKLIYTMQKRIEQLESATIKGNSTRFTELEKEVKLLAGWHNDTWDMINSHDRRLDAQDKSIGELTKTVQLHARQGIAQNDHHDSVGDRIKGMIVELRTAIETNDKVIHRVLIDQRKREEGMERNIDALTKGLCKLEVEKHVHSFPVKGKVGRPRKV